jgi:enoyl-CoA hydratase/carnithine racemase
MGSNVRRDRDGAVLLLTLDRPAKKNALTDAMYGDLVEGLRSAEADDDIRVVLLSGVGADFTAGNDIADFAAVATETIDPADRHVHRFLAELVRFPKPLVAAVPGLAVGIGTTLLLHCDLVFLGESARLSVPFVNLGLVPEAGASLLLPARFGHVRAFAMFALGEVVDAPTALAWGLANRVVPDGRLAAEALAAAQTLASRPAGAIVATKRLMREQRPLTDQIATELESFEACLRSPEAQAAFRAFAERRKAEP